MLSVRAAAGEAPDHVALIGAGWSLDYRELAERVVPRAQWLLTERISRLAVVAERRLEPLLMMLAAIEAGVPLVLLHPRWSPDERGSALAGAGCELVVHEEFEFLTSTGGKAELPKASDIDPESCLAVVFTSGSAGRPRGVVLSRRAFVAAAAASASHLSWRSDDRWLVSLPLAHVGGFGIVVRTLLARRTAVLAAPGSARPHELCALIDREAVTLLSLVPTTLRRLLECTPRWQPAPALRAILVGGAACPVTLRQRARERAWPVLLTWGMTETCGQVATQVPGSPIPAEDTVGPVLPGIQLSIQDSEILVAGPTLLSGVLAEETSPFDSAGRLRTGDLGRLDEQGRLVVLGRRDGRIHTGGEKVQPGEIEEAIRSFPGVADACVVGLADEHWGQVVAAAVEADLAAHLDVEHLQRHLREQLAPWKRPKQIRLLAALPRTLSGKVDRAGVSLQLAAPGEGALLSQ